jgi:hypothetical protein
VTRRGSAARSLELLFRLSDHDVRGLALNEFKRDGYVRKNTIQFRRTLGTCANFFYAVSRREHH